MGKLHEVIAVESSLKKQVETLKEDAKKTFDSRNAAYTGFSKTYEPDNENDPEKRNPEGKAVGYTVQKKIAYFREFLARFVDCQFQKETANQVAKADIVLSVDDGAESALTIAENVPVTMLLNLETQLTNFREIIKEAPTLDPNFSWSWNDNEGCWATQPILKRVHRKVTKPIVLYDATDKHPAQTQLISEDIQVGTTTEITKSGALSVKQKAEIMTKLDIMLNAVKRARMKANDTEVPTGKIAKGIFDYILNV